MNKVRMLDRGPELCGLVTFYVNGSGPSYLTEQLLERKINVVSTYRAFAVIDFAEKNVDWAIRASPHYYNTKNEIDQFIETLKEIIK
jgi:selenocysteine lyase/cysteine desulfurase